MQSGVQPQVPRQVTFVQINLVTSPSESGSAAASVALFACTRTSTAKAFISSLLPMSSASHEVGQIRPTARPYDMARNITRLTARLELAFRLSTLSAAAHRGMPNFC